MQQEPWINRPKPKTDVPEPNPGNGTAEQLKATIEIIALALQTGLNARHQPCHLVCQWRHLAQRRISWIFPPRGTTRSGRCFEKDRRLPNSNDVLSDRSPQSAGRPDQCGHPLPITPPSFTAVEWQQAPIRRKNLPLVLAGGGFKHGEHKVYPDHDSNRVPAANLLLSILQNSGLEIDRFGSSTGRPQRSRIQSLILLFCENTLLFTGLTLHSVGALRAVHLKK